MNKPWDNEPTPIVNVLKECIEDGSSVPAEMPELAENLERRLRHAEEQIELLLEGLDFCEEDTGGLTNKQWDKRIRSARAHLEAARQEDGR